MFVNVLYERLYFILIIYTTIIVLKIVFEMML